MLDSKGLLGSTHCFSLAPRYAQHCTLSPTLDLFDTQAMLDTVRKRPEFDFSEYKSMLKLQSGVDQALGDDASAGDSDYKLLLLDLEALTIMDE